MSKSYGKVVLGLLLCVAAATQALAQLYPLPRSKSEQPAICTNCQSTNSAGQPNAGLPTYPYDQPLVDFVGRYVDSSTTISYQHVGIRTVRAGQIRVAPSQRGSAPPRIYVQLGEAVGAYSLSSFFATQLPGAMIPVTRVKTGGCYDCRTSLTFEKIAPFDAFVYPEASTAKWYTPFSDGQQRLFDFDYDDRGNLYAAYHMFGWGILKDDGRTGGNLLDKVVQKVLFPRDDQNQPINPGIAGTVDDAGGIDTPRIMIALKTGGKYYAITGDAARTHVVYEATDAAAPRLLFKRSDPAIAGIRKWDRHDESQRLAYVTNLGRLYIWDYADIVNGSGAPVDAPAGTFLDVSFDESGNLWAIEKNKIWKFDAVGNGYTQIPITLPAGTFENMFLHVNAGHLAVHGIDRNGSASYDLRIYKIDSTGLTLVNIDKFFAKYYYNAPQDYASGCTYCNGKADLSDVQIVKHANKTYVMYSIQGLGDVFELAGGDSIQLSTRNTHGTVNPNAKPVENGPFVGDVVSFTAASSNASVAYDVTWEFGNPESADNTAGPKKTGLDVSHQYTGLTTTSAVTAPKTVRAITVQDSQIAAQMLVQLKVPTPRVGISGLTNPIVANTSSLDVVAGSTFKDASDGSIESHFGTWTIDGVPTKYKPNADVPVGIVGAHTLKFQGSYGKYDPTLLTGTGLFNTPELTIGYTVKPFIALIKPPTRTGSNIKFTGDPALRTSDATILSAPTWNVTWTLTNSLAGAGSVSTSAVKTQGPSAVTVGSIPDFTVAESELTPGSTVELKINVDTAGLSVPAQAFATDTDVMTLTPPDPLIEQTGCANANGDCRFVARSAGNKSMTDWSYAWTLRKDTAAGSVVGTSTAATYEPTIATAGTYVMILTATKGIFETRVEKAFSAAASLCGPPPSSFQVAINKAGCATSCATGTTVTFTPSFNGYTKQACDTISWTFHDGTTATGSPVQKTYSTAGTHNVTMKITNSSGSLTETTTVTVTGSGGGNDGGGNNTCTAPTNGTFNWSGTAGCAPGTNCRTTETINFTAKRGTFSLLSCDNTSWNFGDNTTSTSKTPSKTYSTPGTYTVTLVISNSQGSQTITRDVTVVAPPAGNCSKAPALGNFAITYSGGTSNCSNTNPSCQHGETVSFNAQAFQYAVNSCDIFTWDFGDGTTGVTGRTPTHVFTGNLPEYGVKVKVSNNAGEYTFTRTLKFVNSTPTQPLPVIATTTFPATGHKGKSITFVATSNMATTTGWTWNFGDGTAADTSQSGQTMAVSTMTHTFANPGTYTVRVTARNSTDSATATPGSAQANITITNPPAIPEYRYLLPSTAYLETGNWRTDVQIYNPDPQVSETKPLIMEATFKGKTYPMEMIKSTHIYEDFLGGLLSHQRFDQGPVIITTKNVMAPPQIWTRTYSNTAGGTYGQFVPAIRLDNVGGSGAATAEGAYYLSGLRHDSRYRTNLGLLNPNDVSVTVNVKVYDEEGFDIGDFPVTLGSFELLQFQLAQRMPAGKPLPSDKPFSVKIDVPPAQWLVAYASYIDGMSSDPVYLQAVRDSDVTAADFKKSVIPGVGHTGGWRSDVTIFNPDGRGIQFDLRYYNSAGEKKAEALSVKLGGGEFLQYGDILKQGILGNVDDGIGTLELDVKTSDVAVYPMTFARTYFDDLANGTYGQGIGGFAPARANVKPNKAAFIAGVRNSSTYYTNIGLLNVSDAPVTAKVTLLDPTTGAPVNSIDYTLAPHQNIVGRYNGFGSIQTGTFKIEANGNVWAFASIIDTRTKDPEYVPAQ